VLSALEGLTLFERSLQPYVLPLAVAVLLALFLVQPLGTARIGRAFGPVMTLWFVTIAVLGIAGIARHPAVLWALNPWYAVEYLRHGGYGAFAVLGGVFLCVTGAEALYADMGHFGARPIRLSWAGLVFPSLVLNYAGQGAIVLAGAPIEGNIFYRLCPGGWLMPLVLLSTVATIIASQAIIAGAFSMTRQAIQLGWMPRLKVVQTSDEGYGQIYVGTVNWLLMIATVALALAFRKSDNLAGAYGIAVSATMLLTTALLYTAMRDIWKWSPAASLAVAAVFFAVDGSFFASNMLKLLEGGYVPLLLAAAVYAVMFIWHRGLVAIARRVHENPVPVAEFFARIERDRVARVPGTAVFLTRVKDATPPVMVWYVRHSHALHEKVIAVTLETASVPRIAPEERIQLAQPAPNFWVASVCYGFMERPDMPDLMRELAARGCGVVPEKLTYFVGSERVVARERGGLPHWVEAIFSFLLRNATHMPDYLNVPRDRLIDLGRQISI
jgi:KUP system potassium uptake protein